MKAFVTGGSGFVGRYLIQMLHDRGYQVNALARSNDAADRVAVLGAEVIRGDLFDKSALLEGMQDCDVVFHVAGYLSIWGSYKAFYTTNVTGTECVLEAAQLVNVPKFVQIGAAASVFNREPLSQIDERSPLQQPSFSPYIATKSIAEQRVIVANRPGFCTTVVRPSWIWGKGDHVLPQLVHAVRTRQFVWIDRGNYAYMTTHVMNACHGAILAAQYSPGGEAYFLSDGDTVQFREWVTALLHTQGVQPGKLSIPRWLAWKMARLTEEVWRMTRRKSTPPMTRTMVR